MKSQLRCLLILLGLLLLPAGMAFTATTLQPLWGSPVRIDTGSLYIGRTSPTQTAAAVRFYDGSNNYTLLNQPATALNTTLSLPVDAPNVGDFLRFGTAGQMDWSIPAGTLSGSGTDNYIAVWTGASALEGTADFQWDNSTDVLTLDTVTITESTDMLTLGTGDALDIDENSVGAVFGVRGTYSGTSDGAAGIKGIASGASGATFGLYGTCASSDTANAYGVYSDRTRIGDDGDLIEQGSAPATPPGGKLRMYADNATFEKLHGIDDAGNNYTYANQHQSAMMYPPGAFYGAGATTMASARSYMCYVGKAPAPFTSCNVRANVTTALTATIVWANVTVLTGSFNLAGVPTLTARGSTDVSAIFNATGSFSVPVTTSGIQPGDDIWIAVGSSTSGTAFQLQAAGTDPLADGVYVFYTGGDVSAASALAMTAVGTTSATRPWIGLNVAW